MQEIWEKKSGDETLTTEKFTNLGIAISGKGAIIASMWPDFLSIFLFLFILVVFNLSIGQIAVKSMVEKIIELSFFCTFLIE